MWFRTLFRWLRPLWLASLAATFVAGPVILAVVHAIPGPHRALENVAMLFWAYSGVVFSLFVIFAFVDSLLGARGHEATCACPDCRYLQSIAED